VPVDAGPFDPDAGFPDATPPPVDAGPALLPHGAACRFAAECEGDTCLRASGWTGGYCTTLRCADDLQCGRPEAACVTPDAPSIPLCADVCGPDDPCRDGYTCAPRGRATVCLPTPVVPADRQDGDACTDDAQCLGGTCLRPPDWPDGHCTTLRCVDPADCATFPGVDNACVPDLLGTLGEAEWCARVCESFSDCREGYACVPLLGEAGLCLPDDAPAPPISMNEIAGLGMQCGLRSSGGRLNVDYSVSADSSSYMITVLSRDGRYVVPERITGPGRNVDFRGDNAFQARMALSQGWVAPVLVPQTPGTVDQRAPGAHRFELSTRSQDVCWYLLEEATDGLTIDLNVHLVGLRGVTAANAASSQPLQAVLRALDTHLSQTGVRLGDVRYVDADASTARRFSILRARDDFPALMATSPEPGQGRDALLSLNLFFVRSIQFPDGGPIGISSGLPGPAGLHGTRASGVVSTAEFFGVTFENPIVPGELVDGNEYTGLIIAHEIGHYLGLFHTTEIDGERHDPIADTPECSSRDFPLDCPDLGNLMFPIGVPGNIALTAGQAHTVRANPLSKD